jgi:hypothetical protein
MRQSRRGVARLKSLLRAGVLFCGRCGPWTEGTRRYQQRSDTLGVVGGGDLVAVDVKE